MKSVNYDELTFVLEQLCEKRDVLQDQIDNNTLLMQGLEDHDYNDQPGNENDDLFSPRKKIGNRYHREKAEQDRAVYQQQNEEYIFDRNKINILIDTIQRVIEAEKDSSPDTVNTEEQQKNDQSDSTTTDTLTEENNFDEKEYHSVSQELNRISRKIEICKKMISQDPHRAKLELDTINKKIRKMINDVSHETNS